MGIKGQHTELWQIHLRLVAGGWVPVCRDNAATLVTQPFTEVQMKRRCRDWVQYPRDYEHHPGTLFRVRVPAR
jgi:hypothetical protein